MYEVDTKTAKVVRQLPLSRKEIEVEGNKFQLGTANVPTITKDGSKIFVCVNGYRDNFGIMHSNRGGFLDIVDTKSLKLTKEIPQENGLHDCYTTPDGKYIIGSSVGGKILSVFDANTGDKAWDISLDKGFTTTAQELNPDGSTRRLFSNLTDFRGFAVIDFATHKEVARVALPDDPKVLMPEKVRRRNRMPTHGNEITPDGKQLWVVSRGANGVFIYSLPNLKLQKFIATPRMKGAPLTAETGDGGDPGWISFSHEGKTAYVPNAAVNSVSAIDTKTMKIIAEIPVGEQPDHVFTLVLPDSKRRSK
jgi:YVTN family beta-propeller protein